MTFTAAESSLIRDLRRAGATAAETAIVLSAFREIEQVIDLAARTPAWVHEARGKDGKWTKGAGSPARAPSMTTRVRTAPPAAASPNISFDRSILLNKQAAANRAAARQQELENHAQHVLSQAQAKINEAQSKAHEAAESREARKVRLKSIIGIMTAVTAAILGLIEVKLGAPDALGVATGISPEIIKRGLEIAPEITKELVFWKKKV